MPCKMKNLNKRILAQIVKLILAYKKPERIVIFGSRVSDNCRDSSDIDIAIFGKGWTDKDTNITKHILEEYIKIPLKFDVLNFYALTKGKLKENILKKGEAIYDSGKD